MINQLSRWPATVSVVSFVTGAVACWVIHGL